MNPPSAETPKYRHLVTKYCNGCGVDIGSQGITVVPWAISYDLPKWAFDPYCGGEPQKGPIHLRGWGDALPFENECFDWVYSSHLLEDYADWEPVLQEWNRVLRPNGYLIILIPDKERWNEALKNGQPPNDAHRHEGRVGELSIALSAIGLNTITDDLTNLFHGDYTILYVGQKRYASELSFKSWEPDQISSPS